MKKNSLSFQSSALFHVADVYVITAQTALSAGIIALVKWRLPVLPVMSAFIMVYLEEAKREQSAGTIRLQINMQNI